VGYLNDKVYADSPQTIDALDNNIRTEIRRNPHGMLDRVISYKLRCAKSSGFGSNIL